MKIIKIKSGLGNQMFQYAFAKNYQKKTKDNIFLDLSQYEIEHLHNGYELSRIFNIDIPVAPKEQVERLATIPNSFFNRLKRKFITKKTHYIEKEGTYDLNVFSYTDDHYFEGYWQSEDYFSDIKDIIADYFIFKLEKNTKTLEATSFIDEKTASIHIRRGDYLLQKNKKLNICNKHYYNNAINQIKNKINIKKLLIFSDDIPWSRENLQTLGLETLFVDWNKKEDSWQDMFLMSICTHNIIANSSFSWWGAYLNKNPDKIVIAPSKWSSCQEGNVQRLPASWEKIEV